MEHYNGRPVSYYTVLGIGQNATFSDIRSAYRRLAMKWHPDRRNSREPWLIEEANRRFQLIQEAYQVLGDENNRRLYDCGLYDPLQEDEEEDEGLHEFMQEMTSLMSNDGSEAKQQYSLEELQKMFLDMAQGFDSSFSSQPQWSSVPHVIF